MECRYETISIKFRPFDDSIPPPKKKKKMLGLLKLILCLWSAKGNI